MKGIIVSNSPDGSRRRRLGDDLKAKWYAYYRSIRFHRRFGINELCDIYSDEGEPIEIHEIIIMCRTTFEDNEDNNNNK